MNPCLRVILQRKHKFIGSSLTFCHTRVCLIFLSNPEILISAMNGSLVQGTFWRYKILQYLKPATNTLLKAKGLHMNRSRLIRTLLKLIKLLVTDYRSHISPFMYYEHLRFWAIMGLCLCFLGYEIFHSYLLHNGLVNQMIKKITNLPFILHFR